MELAKSRNIIKSLAQGVHPTTGEVFPPESPYNDPEVIRALFSILQHATKAKAQKRTVEERQQENLKAGRPGNSGLPWTEDHRRLVKSGFQKGLTVEKLAANLERSPAAIVAEVIRQDLVPPGLR